MANAVEFDWDAANISHLKRHRVTPMEFEEVLTGDPAFLAYEDAAGEERYKVLGPTKSSRLLIAVWTPRDGRVRAITAYNAGRAYKKLFSENLK
ncbi:MAG: BrnT family toxin [Bryobacteraceae bacterium]